MVITFVNEKGGSGKSTFCLNLAIRLMQEGKEVMIVNCDPQDSIGVFAECRDRGMQQILHTNLNGESVRETLKSLIEKYEFILIDTAGVDSTMNRKATLLSNLVIIPTKPSQFDADTLQKMIMRVKDCQDLNENLQACVVINQISSNPRLLEKPQLQSFIQEVIAEQNPNIHFLDSIIHERIAYKRCISEGMGISEYSDKTCKEEFEVFYQEIKSKFNF